MTERPWMVIVRILVAAVFVALLLVLLSVSTVNADTVGSPAIERTTEAVEFRTAMRELWEDHVFYTRMAIISVFGDQKDLTPTLFRP